jgi:hypothetical protein
MPVPILLASFPMLMSKTPRLGRYFKLRFQSTFYPLASANSPFLSFRSSRELCPELCFGKIVDIFSMAYRVYLRASNITRVTTHAIALIRSLWKVLGIFTWNCVLQWLIGEVIEHRGPRIDGVAQTLLLPSWTLSSSSSKRNSMERSPPTDEYADWVKSLRLLFTILCLLWKTADEYHEDSLVFLELRFRNVSYETST